MVNDPLVSIIIPTYNQRETFLIQCIESAIAQTYRNIEIIVSDNHSTNGAPAILKEYQVKDSRLKVVKPPQHISLMENFKFVVRQAKGKYISFVSSDDMMMPACIDTLVYKMEEDEGISFAHGKAIYFNPDETFTVEWKYFNETAGVYPFNKEAAERLLRLNYVCFGGVLVRNNVFEDAINILDRLKIEYTGDILVTLIFFKHGSLYYADEVLARIRQENPARGARYIDLIKDATEIWTYLGTDPVLLDKIKNNGLDFEAFKKTNFITNIKILLYLYLNSKFDSDAFKRGLKNLQEFNLNMPFKYRCLIMFVSAFPNLAKSIYKVIAKKAA